jgi:hypothetical protein
MKHKTQKLKLQKNYTPKIQNSEEIEIYPNGIFKFFISKIIEDIEDRILQPQKVRINIKKWLQTHYRGLHNLNENHLPSVNTRKPIIQAEIKPNHFEIIDGNHRFEKAFRDGKKSINSYKLYVKDLLPYFYDKQGYEAFVKYWNSKLNEM